MSLINKPYTWSAGATIIAAEHNSNHDTIYSDYNGNITNSNISGSAAIAYSKLTLAGSVVNADINASAGIVDTKLAQITTVGKVSTTALTLSSQANGVILLANGTTTWTGLSGGTTGYFLTAQGVNTLPIYTAPPTAAGLVLVSTTSFSTAADSGSIAITSTKSYVARVVLTTGSGALNPWVRFNTDSNSHYGWINTGSGASTAKQAVTSDTKIVMVNGSFNLNNIGYMATLNIYPQVGTANLFVDGNALGGDGTNVYGGNFSGVWNNSAAATSFAIVASVGTITGTVYLYSYALS